MWSMSPIRTSREGLADCWLEVMRFMSQALDASSRVLKKRAAHSHLSMRVPVMDLCLLLYFLLHDRFYARLDGAQQAAGEIEECGDEFECAAYRDADDAEWQ